MEQRGFKQAVNTSYKKEVENNKLLFKGILKNTIYLSKVDSDTKRFIQNESMAAKRTNGYSILDIKSLLGVVDVYNSAITRMGAINQVAANRVEPIKAPDTDKTLVIDSIDYEYLVASHDYGGKMVSILELVFLNNTDITCIDLGNINYNENKSFLTDLVRLIKRYCESPCQIKYSNCGVDLVSILKSFTLYGTPEDMNINSLVVNSTQLLEICKDYEIANWVSELDSISIVNTQNTNIKPGKLFKISPETIYLDCRSIMVPAVIQCLCPETLIIDVEVDEEFDVTDDSYTNLVTFKKINQDLLNRAYYILTFNNTNGFSEQVSIINIKTNDILDGLGDRLLGISIRNTIIDIYKQKDTNLMCIDILNEYGKLISIRLSSNTKLKIFNLTTNIFNVDIGVYDTEFFRCIFCKSIDCVDTRIYTV